MWCAWEDSNLQDPGFESGTYANSVTRAWYFEEELNLCTPGFNRKLYLLSYRSMARRQGIEPCWGVLEALLIPDHNASYVFGVPSGSLTLSPCLEGRCAITNTYGTLAP